MLHSKPVSYFVLSVFIISTSCKKDFLDAKPSSALVTPTQLKDFQALLENVDVMNRATPALLHLGADEYLFTNDAAWASTAYNAERNSYTWAKDLYEGQKNIKDWNAGYTAIFVANSVIEGLDKLDVNSETRVEWNNLKGWALFMRAYVLYDLVRSFSPVYDRATAKSDLGMPVRLKPGIDEIKPRASLEETYQQIIADLNSAGTLLPPEIAVNNRERPSGVAVSALLARIYLSMRNYEKAEEYAVSALDMYSTLIDYNTINPAERIPFSMNNAETILNTTIITNYYDVSSIGGFINFVTVNPELYNLYADNDLRKQIFFGTNIQSGMIYMRFGYAGAYVSPFSGLATDELYLIRSECQARRNDASGAMLTLNTLLIKRYRREQFVPLTAASSANALNIILTERRKELVWRCLRWSDLKRLNKEGANIILSRSVNAKTYTLLPNDPRYVFPIPDDEIALSGIQQNIR
jgi:tetratricopeptide (TPR) repeat protein